MTHGVDLGSDRDVEINIQSPTYIGSSDTVVVRTTVADNDGNTLLNSDCTFTAGIIDIIPPVFTNQVPTCGTGLAGEPYIPRNFIYKFKVSDAGVGVDKNSLNVSYGDSATGPWPNNMISAGSFVNNFTGSIVSDGSGGYDGKPQRQNRQRIFQPRPTNS